MAARPAAGAAVPLTLTRLTLFLSLCSHAGKVVLQGAPRHSEFGRRLAAVVAAGFQRGKHLAAGEARGAGGPDIVGFGFAYDFRQAQAACQCLVPAGTDLAECRMALGEIAQLPDVAGKVIREGRGREGL